MAVWKRARTRGGHGVAFAREVGKLTCEPRVERRDLRRLAGDVVDDLERRLEPLVDVRPVVDHLLFVGAEAHDHPHWHRLQPLQRAQECLRVVG